LENEEHLSNGSASFCTLLLLMEILRIPKLLLDMKTSSE